MKHLISLGLVAMMAAAPSFAAGDAEAGKAKAAICAACHGANGIAAIPGYPNLAGQNPQYIVSALKAYKKWRAHQCASCNHEASSNDAKRCRHGKPRGIFRSNEVSV